MHSHPLSQKQGASSFAKRRSAPQAVLVHVKRIWDLGGHEAYGYERNAREVLEYMGKARGYAVRSVAILLLIAVVSELAMTSASYRYPGPPTANPRLSQLAPDLGSSLLSQDLSVDQLGGGLLATWGAHPSGGM